MQECFYSEYKVVNHLPSFYSRKITGSAFTQCLSPQPIISIYIDESRYSHATNGVALGGRPRGEPCTVRWYSPSLRCAAADHPIQVVPELVVILEVSNAYPFTFACTMKHELEATTNNEAC